MTEFADFKPFFDAMIKKMQKKDPEYRDSWRDWDWVWYKDGKPATPITHKEKRACYTVPMEEHLDNLLKWELEEYKESGDSSELIDIANFCAMRYMRVSEVKPEQ